jgi:hypothetical protein
MNCIFQINICQNFRKKITNYFYRLQISEKYMSNYSQISEQITKYSQIAVGPTLPNLIPSFPFPSLLFPPNPSSILAAMMEGSASAAAGFSSSGMATSPSSSLCWGGGELCGTCAWGGGGGSVELCWGGGKRWLQRERRNGLRTRESEIGGHKFGC